MSKLLIALIALSLSSIAVAQFEVSVTSKEIDECAGDSKFKRDLCRIELKMHKKIYQRYLSQGHPEIQNPSAETLKGCTNGDSNKAFNCKLKYFKKTMSENRKAAAQRIRAEEKTTLTGHSIAKQAALGYYRDAEKAAKEGKPDRVEQLRIKASQTDPNATVPVQWSNLAEISRAAKAKIVANYTRDFVSIPGGSFRMGCVSGQDCLDNEKPVRSVHIKPFKMGRYEVTWSQYQPCIKEGVCPDIDNDGNEDLTKGNQPVAYVSWNDVNHHFIPWLNKRTGKHFRLPTEAEWEYAARAGSTTKYSWGNDISCSQVSYGDYIEACGEHRAADPVGSFSPNKFGLHDMHGSVWEWTQDCWNDSYAGAPKNGSAWLSGDCTSRIARGGSRLSEVGELHSAFRLSMGPQYRFSSYGFRLVQE